ncbi:hypothetical protein MTP99_010669 [Tenebrio molitor]|jgi:hypothetical protein|nr:hypothetical protein MTP99_010669 [Tenebrio molitor]CAH1369198.1 unnamed protein product [Tenebrio molitor]
MSKSPITVQQWVESLPPPHSNPPNMYSSPLRNTRRFLPREISLQSDDASSHCSSVESVLELRKPDPEAVLLGLGFGPPRNNNLVSRIPSRFLQPSKLLTQIDIDKFLEQYGEPKCSSHQSAPPSPARTQPKSC